MPDLPRRRPPRKDQDRMQPSPPVESDPYEAFNAFVQDVGKPVLGGAGLIKILKDMWDDWNQPPDDMGGGWYDETAGPFDWQAEPTGLGDLSAPAQATEVYPWTSVQSDPSTWQPEPWLPNEQDVMDRLARSRLGHVLDPEYDDFIEDILKPLMAEGELPGETLDDVDAGLYWWDLIRPQQGGYAPRTQTGMWNPSTEEVEWNPGWQTKPPQVLSPDEYLPPGTPNPNASALPGEEWDYWRDYALGEKAIGPLGMDWTGGYERPKSFGEVMGWPESQQELGPDTVPERPVGPQLNATGGGFWDWSGDLMSDINQFNPVEWIDTALSQGAEFPEMDPTSRTMTTLGPGLLQLLTRFPALFPI